MRILFIIAVMANLAKRDILEEIREARKAQRLVPSRDLVERLMVSPRMSTAAQVEALLDQVEIARNKGRKEWLKQVAKDALALQFHSRAWINSNIYDLGGEKKKSVASKMPEGRSRDIRLRTDPNLERREENAASLEESVRQAAPLSPVGEERVSPMQEEEVLAGDVSLNASIPSEEERALLYEEDPGLIIKPHPLMEVDDPHRENVGEIELAAVYPKQVTFCPEVTSQYEQRPRPPVETPLRLQEQRPSPLRRRQLIKTQEFTRSADTSLSGLKGPKGRSVNQPTVRPKDRSGPSSRGNQKSRGYPRNQKNERRTRGSTKSANTAQTGPLVCSSASLGYGYPPEKRQRLGLNTGSVTDLPFQQRGTYVEPTETFTRTVRRPYDFGESEDRNTIQVVIEERPKSTSCSREEHSVVHPQAIVQREHAEMGGTKRKRSYTCPSAVSYRQGRRASMTVCPVAGCDKPKGAFPKQHAFRYHIPSIFNEDLDARETAFRRVAALKLISLWMLGAGATLQELTRYVNSIDLLSEEHNREVTDKQVVAMRELCVKLTLDPPEVFTLYPLNSPAGLFHWRALVLIIAQLEPRYRQELCSQFDCSLREEDEPTVMEVTEKSVHHSPIHNIPWGYDSHFHLDRSRKSHRLSRKATLNELCAKYHP